MRFRVRLFQIMKMQMNNDPCTIILSYSSSGLYELRNEVVGDLLRDNEVYISLPDNDAYTKILADMGCHIFALCLIEEV